MGTTSSVNQKVAELATLPMKSRYRSVDRVMGKAP
jgi:hypothetical protein